MFRSNVQRKINLTETILYILSIKKDAVPPLIYILFQKLNHNRKLSQNSLQLMKMEPKKASCLQQPWTLNGLSRARLSDIFLKQIINI